MAGVLRVWSGRVHVLVAALGAVDETPVYSMLFPALAKPVTLDRLGVVQLARVLERAGRQRDDPSRIRAICKTLRTSAIVATANQSNSN